MTSHEEQKKSILSNLTVQILIAVVLGAILGVFIFKNFAFFFNLVINI